MKTNQWKEVRARRLSPAKLKEIDRQVAGDLLEMSLRELREEAGKTQVDVSEAAEIAQAEVSKFERREDHLLSSLRRFVQALGGELEVVAVLGNKRITLSGV